MRTDSSPTVYNVSFFTRVSNAIYGKHGNEEDFLLATFFWTGLHAASSILLFSKEQRG